MSETHKGIETCSTVPCSEIFKANLHILSTIFGHLKLNSKWPLCYKRNLSWNIAYFIEVLSSFDYYMLCNYPVSFLEHKKGRFIWKKYFEGKSEYSVAWNQRNVWWLHVSSKLRVSDNSNSTYSNVNRLMLKLLLTTLKSRNWLNFQLSFQSSSGWTVNVIRWRLPGELIVVREYKLVDYLYTPGIL